jgi:hypothetical protein
MSTFAGWSEREKEREREMQVRGRGAGGEKKETPKRCKAPQLKSMEQIETE